MTCWQWWAITHQLHRSHLELISQRNSIGMKNFMMNRIVLGPWASSLYYNNDNVFFLRINLLTFPYQKHKILLTSVRAFSSKNSVCSFQVIWMIIIFFKIVREKHRNPCFNPLIHSFLYKYSVLGAQVHRN